MANKPKVIITFYLVGRYRSFDAAINWAFDEGYYTGVSDDCDNLIALKKGEVPKQWKTLTPTDRSNIDGIMYSENFREGAVTINIYK